LISIFYRLFFENDLNSLYLPLRTLRLFEVSLLDYWIDAKVNFYLTAGLKLLKQFKGDILDQFIDEEPELEPLKLIKIGSLFLWLLYCSIFHSIVFVSELLYSSLSERQRKFRANRTAPINASDRFYLPRLY